MVIVFFAYSVSPVFGITRGIWPNDATKLVAAKAIAMRKQS
ncbi:MAG: hypothetical protein ABIT05_06185 [Chitinophagaceae bacterium]